MNTARLAAARRKIAEFTAQVNAGQPLTQQQRQALLNCRATVRRITGNHTAA